VLHPPFRSTVGLCFSSGDERQRFAT